jgi:hypothetical protein
VPGDLAEVGIAGPLHAADIDGDVGGNRDAQCDAFEVALIADCVHLLAHLAQFAADGMTEEIPGRLFNLWIDVLHL